MNRYFAAAALLLIVLGRATLSAALPFNTDMFDTNKLQPGTTVRTPVAGTVPIGTKDRVETKDEALTLSNPLAGDQDSALRGHRLYQINCAPCHGEFDKSKGAMTPGSVAPKMLMAGPDISQQFYKEKPDGLFYGTIHFGGYVFMPPVGWKLSPGETWDIVSYVRSIQNR